MFVHKQKFGQKQMFGLKQMFELKQMFAHKHLFAKKRPISRILYPNNQNEELNNHPSLLDFYLLV